MMKYGVRGAAVLLLLVGCSVDFAGTEPAPFGFPPGSSREAGVDGGDSPLDPPDATADGSIPDAGDGDDPEDDAGPSGPPPPPPPDSCGALAHGASEERVRYLAAEVSNHAQCVPETQTRTCNDGTLTDWTGSAQELSCGVGLLGICDGVVPCTAGSCVDSKTLFLVTQCLGDTGDPCGDDSACVDTCIDGGCAPLSDAAGACDGHDDCEPLACIGSGLEPSCYAGTCQCENQALCTSDEQCLGVCAGFRCVDFDTRCDALEPSDCAETSICRTTWCRRPDGAACERNENCRGTCVAGQCVPEPGLSEACDDALDCGADQTCSVALGSARCLLDDGEACSDVNECASLTCGCSNPPCQEQTFCGAEPSDPND